MAKKTILGFILMTIGTVLFIFSVASIMGLMVLYSRAPDQVNVGLVILGIATFFVAIFSIAKGAAAIIIKASDL